MSSQANRRKTRVRQIALILLGLLVISFGVFRVAARMRVRHRIDAIRAAGYPVALSELNAWYERPGLTGNAADYVMEATARLRIPEGEDREPLPLFGDSGLPEGAQSLDRETQERVDSLLAENAEALELLHQAATTEQSRYPVDFTRGHAVVLTHISEMSKAARLLALEAVTHADQDHPEAAAQSVVCGYALARTLLREPSFISQMVRCTCDTVATDTLQYVLSRTQPAEGSLAEIDRAILTTRDPNAMTRALVGERCLGHEALRNPRSLGLSAFPNKGEPSLVLVEIQRAIGTLDLRWAAYLDTMEAYIETTSLPPHQQLRAAEAVEARYGTAREPRSIARFLTPAAARFISLDLMDVARLQTARTAVAVERYRAATGQLPGRLDDLAPKYLDELPLDPFDGRHLRYEIRPKGYLIYSVGWDEADDGGTPRPPRRRGQEQANYDITFIVER